MDFFLAMMTRAANDNAPHDPRDYEDFDPSVLPHDAVWDDDTPIAVDTFMSLLA
jgi:hypothetical protein